MRVAAIPGSSSSGECVVGVLRAARDKIGIRKDGRSINHLSLVRTDSKTPNPAGEGSVNWG